ncbi:MAG: SRPBCC domain-containing protein [Planctomycetes bacterium]|nr:SRPBCC domain-containing protein [Planctomycetota bacterium]
MTNADLVSRTAREAIELRADTATVWHALVRRTETPRWLGAGAVIEAKGDGECRWTNQRGETFEGRIDNLAPTRRLVANASDGGSIEFQFDHRGRGTMVRAVRTALVARDAADELATAESCEWRIALLALRAHVDSAGSAETARAGVWTNADRTSAWRAMFGVDALIVEGAVDQLQRRDGFTLAFAGGLKLTGRASTVEREVQFVGETQTGELLTLSALRGARGTFVHIALMGSARRVEELNALEAAWRTALETRFALLA